MRFGQIVVALVAGLMVVGGAARAADGVSVNLDALPPEKTFKKPSIKSPPISPDAVRSDIVPDDEPASAPKPKPKPAATVTPPQPVAQPAARPAAATPVVTTIAPGEIDFINRSKGPKTSAPKPQIVPPATVAATKPATPPVMTKPVTDDAIPPAPPIVAAVKPPVPPKKPAPDSVVIDGGALESVSEAPASGPKGQPLTSIAPNGALFVPKNVEGLPQPVAVERPATPDEDAPSPLTVPPGLQDAPTPTPSTEATPPSTQAVAAIATRPQSNSVAAAPARASALDGHATAAELLFPPGAATLTAEAISSLNDLAAPLKASKLRVQLAAYTGRPGNNSSDARRLSLKRALAVREYLTSKGVAKGSVNVVALGGAPNGKTDRVDVMVRSDQLTRLSSPAQ